MTALLDIVRERAQMRADVEYDFRRALVQAKREHSWTEVARAAGMSVAGVRYLVEREENGR